MNSPRRTELDVEEILKEAQNENEQEVDEIVNCLAEVAWQRNKETL